MLDGQIVAALIAEVKTQLGLYGISASDLNVSRSSQPSDQHAGAVSGAAKYQIFIEPVTNTEIGWHRRYSEPAPGEYDRSINHVKQKTYQISALSDFNPSNAGDIPAHDLAQIVNDMIKHPDSIRTLKDKGVNILSAGPVRPSFQINQSDEYESMPNFDITVSYNTEYTRTVPVVDNVTGELIRI